MGTATAESQVPRKAKRRARGASAHLRLVVSLLKCTMCHAPREVGWCGGMHGVKKIMVITTRHNNWCPVGKRVGAWRATVGWHKH